ncbi:hypothetical protein TNCV_1051061 [Trichonephila clavipes]|nr:hypothetical protein TNCV_1051061 [Trichonephila clavipes]
MLDFMGLKKIKKYDVLLILPAGLGPVKSRQDYAKIRKICHETKRMNFKKKFRTSDCIEKNTTMENDSFRQESPVNTSKHSFFFPEFDTNNFSSFKIFLTVLINNVWNIKKMNNGRSKILLDILREFILNFGVKTNYLKSLTKKAKNY